MAKSRRNRGGASQRRNPIAKPVKPPSDAHLAALREAKILPVIQQLQAADPKARSAAAAAIASLVQDAPCRKLLLREHVVRTILTQTLTDAAWESRAAGWGILRVLAREEEADFCVHLFRSDVLTAVEHAARALGEKLPRAGGGEAEFAKRPRAERALVAGTTASLVALLTALAEAGDEPLEGISCNATIVDLLLLLVSYGGSRGSSGDETGGEMADLRGDALACLVILTEDNGDLSRKLVANTACYEALSSLKDQVSGDGVLACATLHNVFAALETLPGAPLVPPGADDSLLIPTLAKVIARVGAQPQDGAANGTEGGRSSPVEQQQQQQQQLALETLASIGTALISGAESDSPGGRAGGKKRGGAAKEEAEIEEAEEEEEEEDEDMGMDEDEDDDDDDDDEMDQDALEADLEMVTGAADPDDASAPTPVLDALLQLAIPQLSRIASLPPTNDATLLRLRGHALSALNNTAWSLSLVDPSDAHGAALRRSWPPVARTLWQQVVSPVLVLASDTADMRLAAQVTGLAWALARGTILPSGSADADAPLPLPLQPDEHLKFMALYRAAAAAASPSSSEEQDPFRRLPVKCIGLLGHLALHPPLHRPLSAFLLSVPEALPSAAPADAVEALDHLLDIYADDDAPYDKPVFWADGLLARFEALLPRVRAMVKAVDRKTQPEVRARAEHVLLNLGRFVAYKRRRGPGVKSE